MGDLQTTDTPTILFEDDCLLVLFKPSSWFVHPPEDPRHRRGLKRKTCVQWLQDIHAKKAFPAHRIDAGTEGLVIFAKTKLAAQNLNQQFKNQTVNKHYHTVVRGWIQPTSGEINLDLQLDSTGELAASKTIYDTLATVEKDFSINPKFKTSRYSLLQVKPITGRWHQIRRHMNRLSHPVIGDSEHGDLRHNRQFKDQLQIQGLCLRAFKIQFQHPENQKQMEFTAPKTEKWAQIEKLFNFSL